ncbi:hypothetical protein M3Y99_00349900 [Aphelenchoides fujianensis]|nr:hypothetical protein M3Y99_00349900 [Aphelenchoides fujianensis]
MDAFRREHEAEIDEQPLMLGLERMRSHVPADGVDPVLRVFARREWTKAAMSVLTAHAEVIERYNRVVFGPTAPAHSAFEGPPLPNESEFTAFMREKYAATLRSLEEMRELGELCRPRNSEYKRLGQVIADFIKLAERLRSSVGHSEVQTFVNQLQLHRAKLFNEFLAYPDVILPYIHGSAEFEFEINRRSLERAADEQRERLAARKAAAQPATLLEQTPAYLAESSPLPEHAQHELCLGTLDRLTPTTADPNSVMKAAFEWLKGRWAAWFDAHTAKRTQLYEYRQTGRHQRENEGEVGEEEIPDMEMAEVC